MEQAWAGSRNITLVGPGGVGKTRLMEDFARSKGRHFGATGRPGDHLIPLSTVQRGFRAFFSECPEVVAGLPEWVKVEISRFLPELHPAPPPAVRTEAERLRFLEAGYVVNREMGRFGAIVTADDLQYFDPSSFELQAWLTAEIVRRREPGIARSIAAFRPGELPTDYQEVVERMRSAGISEIVRVPPLTEHQVARLAESLGVSVGRIDVPELFRVTGGNPMRVVEAVKAWFETGELGHPEEAGGGMRLGAAGTIRSRMERLEPGDMRLAQTVALLQGEAPTELLSGVTGEPVDRVEARLARLEAQNMLRHNRFVHDLLAEAASATAPAPRRRLLHARIAEVLIARGAEPARVAHHLEEAGRAADAIPWRLDAAEQALAQGSRLGVRPWLDWVLERADPAGEAAARAGVLLGSLLLASDAHGAHDAYLRAAAAARAAGIPTVEAMALAGLAQSAALNGRGDAARRCDEQALALAGTMPAVERARMLSQLSEARSALGDIEASQERIEAAVRLDPSESRYRLALARFHSQRGAYRAAIHEFETVFELDPTCMRRTDALHDLGQNYRALGAISAARQWLERGVAIWRDSGGLLMEGRMRDMLGATLISAGELAEAERQLVLAEGLFRSWGAPVRVAEVQARRAVLWLFAGQPRIAAELATAGVAAFDPAGNPYQKGGCLGVLAWARAGVGELEGTARLLDEGESLAQRNGHPFSRATLLRCRGEVALLAGDAGAARAAATALERLSRRYGMRERLAWAQIMVAEAERGAVARRHARAALALAEAGGYVPVEARAAARLAELGAAELAERAAVLRGRLQIPPPKEPVVPPGA